ncbi:ABC transporter substrate-binding protein [Roseomonas populi]|uniref:ABC transporter substrate-binding protein n=1 Tax=Roseomonas populi TaxID=3121582 RepID=A0ABT1X6R1_9PROT|nr:ABC transporter substrate-binding protein [Roseomonas pecuniae]MCR0983796.1 ABC transporter substrate-binding protein [Roseomonas pecuniae]
MHRRTWATLALSVPWIVGPAARRSAAQEPGRTLTFGNNATVTSLDPHFYTATPNLETTRQIFDGLTVMRADGSIGPALAESWTQTALEIWEFRLRPNLRFSDGTPFTPEDVAFTIDRIPNVPNSPGSFVIFTASIGRVEVVDARTVRLHTKGPDPLVPANLSWVGMLSRRLHAGATTQGFNDGALAIGTGAYRLVSYAPGERIELVRNEGWWGPRPAWDRVVNRTLRNPGARSAALLSGDVDVINGVPTADLARLRADSRLAVAETVGLRIVYIMLDTLRDESPFVTGPNGEPLSRNPLRDPRVRRALAVAIDRNALTERVMEGSAVPTAQVVREGLSGHVPELRPVYDAAAARRLLAEAGFPNGLRLTLHGPNDRYPNDARVLQAVGQMWQRAGVQTVVEAMPWASFSARQARRDFSAWLLGGTAATSEASYPLRSILNLRDAARTNRRYDNPAFEAVLEEVGRTVDPAAREALLRRAVTMSMEDVAIIPLYIQKATFAARRGLRFEPRVDEMLDFASVQPST